MTVFPKLLGQVPVEFEESGIAPDAPTSPLSQVTDQETLPVDEAARELAQGESILGDSPDSDPLMESGGGGGGAALDLLDLAMRTYAPLGVSMGQTTTAFASFGAASSGLYALAEPDPDAVQMSPMAGCSCMACASAAASGAGGNGDGAPGAAVSLQSLADYLRVTFWDQYDDQGIQYYNVTNSGTGANNGVLRYNVTGTPTGGIGTYYGTYTDTNGVSAARATLIRDAFAFYEELLGIDFVETTSTGTEVDFFFIDNRSGAFQAPQFHSGKGGPIDVSIINVNANWESGTSNFADYTYQTFLHEIGHALGLGHQGLYNGSGGYANDALFANDSWAQSMMSYFDQAENTEFSDDSHAHLIGPMAADLIALQALYGSQGYGISNAFNGDTTYGVGTNITNAMNRQFADLATRAQFNAFTIVDADGNDTIDFSNYSANQNINLTVTLSTDLRPTFSSVGGLSKNMALAAGTIIENATTGSGNDTITGNQYANLLDGRAGNDTLYGGAGIDTLYGGEGSDLLYGGSSGDTLKGGGGNDNLFGEAGNDYLKGGAGNDTLYGGSGVDTLQGDEGDDRIVLHTTATTAGAGYYGGADFDVLEFNGAGTWDLRNSTLSGFEELEFYANGTSSVKTVYLTGAQAMGLAANLLIDGNWANASNDILAIYMADSGTTSVDLSGWQFQDWTRNADQTDSLVIYGGATNDTIIGSSASDDIYGNDGNDSLTGNNGDDTLKGGGGSDTLFGGAGNDLMYGSGLFVTGDGSNTFFGGTGNDTAYGGDSYDYFYGAATASSSAFYGNDGDDVFYKASGTTAGNSESWYGGNGANDWLYWTNTTIGLTRVVNLATGFITQNGSDRDVVQGVEHVYLENGAGVIGDGNANWIWATGDYLNNLDGGAGNDTLKGGGGHDTLRGGSGIDLLHGEDGDDYLYDGNSTEGADSMYGGAGNDRLIKESSTNSLALKVWDGGDGIDTFDFAYNGTANWVVDLSAGRILTHGGAARDFLSGIEHVIVRNDQAVVGNADNNNLTGIGEFANVMRGLDGYDTLDGGGGDDWLLGDAGFDILFGGTGNDTLDGGTDDDTLYGGDGQDSLMGADGVDLLYGGLGNDSLYGDAGNDSMQGDDGDDALFGGADNDTLDGWTGNDALYGGLGADFLLGFSGNDTLYGGAGTDTLNGEDGDDLFVTYAAEGLDNYYGGSGFDTLDVSTTNQNHAFDLVAQSYSVGANTRVISSVEVLYLGNGKDTVTGSSEAEAFYGGGKDDVIFGGGGADTIYGGTGKDALHSGSGAVVLSGDVGNDVLYISADFTGTLLADGGGARDEINFSAVLGGVTVDMGTGTATDGVFSVTLTGIEDVVGSLQNDSITGDALANKIQASGGHDVVMAGEGADTVLAGAGNDTVYGGGGADSLVAGGGADQMFGEGGNDTLLGLDGNDLLDGGNGADLLDGGLGRDTLIGGNGTDTLIGGDGVDVFRFFSNGDIGIGATSDRILDFVSGTDKIDLSGHAGATSFIGTGAFSGTAGEVRYYSLGGVGYLAGDTTGNGIANFELLLINGSVVVAGDLIL